MENNIEQIILTKEYEALDKAELAVISEHISSKEEYKQMRELLLKLQSSNEEIINPEPSVKASLVAGFRKSNSLKVVKTPDSLSKNKRIIFVRLSYAALIVAGIFIAFLLIKNSGKKENMIANKTIIKEKNISNDKSVNNDIRTQEKQAVTVIHDNSNSILAINKQANIKKKDTIRNSNDAMSNNSQTKTMKKGRTLNDDIALTDVMYVAL